MKNPAKKWTYAPFFAWLLLFYTGWILLVVFGGHLQVVLMHWPMAAAMAAGSYVAGSTPMGGGTVGFPVLVLLMDLPAALGRDFSFAIQAVGMTSASIYILCSRQELEWPMLRAAILGALIGAPIGILFIAPLASDLFIKLLFASMWCSFGLLHLRRMNEITSYEGMTPHDRSFDHKVGFAVGLLGSLSVASITGVGVDMFIYMVLVLWCHADLKIAIPTSVVLMAFTSIVGITTKLLLGELQAGTFENWLAAAPVVAVGAPFGALVVRKIGRRPTLIVVSLLCVVQFAWTLVHERSLLTAWSLSAAVLGVLLFLLIFQDMYRHGYRLARRGQKAGPKA
ncbi:MAG: sulfite exporter TauE/SafE family protein [Xanthomonadales bacterium]|nr:sulfite exporter TauE/SafE family protein [Gammaproteobacteria bacterium]MBT8055224.1 sulfite exporter TauE/SafE family protein [Gammaproteobacteria bacterium]NND56946.1 sulfite exporter TauE/SafE family protein [Xanthomonadales bacterium]NNK51904.1 sulfite exporter TauE/SafE family protein [Xanthomonadales bacterium]NNL94210.1 sulfite exporter TauE/SafE family protein [Xanthomonadales bacterium]